MKLKLRQILMLMIALVLFVGACGGDEETPVPEASTATPTTAAQAANQSNATESPLSPATVSPIATPAAQSNSTSVSTTTTITGSTGTIYQQPNAIVPPEKGQAVLAGRILAHFGDTDKLEPVVLSAVYLAPVLREADGTPSVASLDSNLDPSSGTDPEGYFVFENVPPGQYGFVIYYGVTHYLIRDDDGKQMLITLEPDQVLDLGVIQTDLPDTW